MRNKEKLPIIKQTKLKIYNLRRQNNYNFLKISITDERIPKALAASLIESKTVVSLLSLSKLKFCFFEMAYHILLVWLFRN
jgi:hypothetical protein